uniref:Uncharacterized protein n=1 Tax=Anguilla anguilla TaxID=7936 RepID=A0A0E9WNY6_ANGAN
MLVHMNILLTFNYCALTGMFIVFILGWVCTVCTVHLYGSIFMGIFSVLNYYDPF